MPLGAVKLPGANRSKICKEEFYNSPNKGFCASQNIHFYGYKIYAVCSIEGVFKSFDISKAPVHDIHCLNDIKDQFGNCVILGGKGYLSADHQLDMFESKQIKLEVQCEKINMIIKNKPTFLERKESE